MRVIGLLILLLVCYSKLFAQITDEVAENVLNMYFQTINQDKLLKTKTYVTKGKILLDETEYPFTSYKKRPNKYRLESNIESKNVISVVNGETGWTIDPISGSSIPSQMSAEVFVRSKQFADYDGIFYNYREKGSQLEYVNDDYVGFIKTHVLKMTTQTDDIITAFFNTQTNVLIKKKTYNLIQGVSVEMEFYYTNYKFVNDILFPFMVEIKSNEDTVMKLLVDEIIFDVDIPDSMFEMSNSDFQD